MELLENIKAYARNSRFAFHCPNHIGKNGFKEDLTELTGLDNLEYPESSIKNAQEEIAEFFGAKASFFLTNGASMGLQAALLALKIELSRKSEKLKPLLLARNVHKSVISAVIQTGFDVEWLDLIYDVELDLFTGFDKSKIKETENYSAIVITNPSYEGFFTELSSLNDLKTPLIVDEAHGAHYYFSDDLPDASLHSGADIVIQSWHKCLTSLTQGAVAHLSKNSKISKESFRDALRLLQTTSPSYMILKSLCESFLLFKESGSYLLSTLKSRTNKIPESIKATNNDFTRLILKIPDALDINLVDAELEKKNIFCEAYSTKSILFFLSIFHEENDFEYLVKSFQEIISIPELRKTQKHSLDNLCILNSEQILNPQRAFFSPSKLVKLTDAKGLISSDYFALCPPGFPIIIPGQIITKGIIERLELSDEFMNLQDGKIKVLLKGV